MGYRIELWTEHEDNGAAIEHLAAQVDDEALMLTSAEDVPEGSWVAFEIKLADGSVFLEGMGRCQGSKDADGVFQVLLGGLQLDTTGELIFERLQLARDDLDKGARHTGEIDISKIASPEQTFPKGSSAPPAVGVAVPRPSAPASEPASSPASAKPASSKPAASKPSSSKPDPTAPPPLKSWKPPPPSSIPRPGTGRPPPATPKVATPKVPKVPKAPARPATAPPPPKGLPAALQTRLSAALPLLQAEGRVRDMAGAHALAVEIGLQAIETMLDEE